MLHVACTKGAQHATNADGYTLLLVTGFRQDCYEPHWTLLAAWSNKPNG